MKKLLALLLSVMLCLIAVSALAEDANTPEETVEVPLVENGTEVPFADYNFQLTLPSDWNVLELTDEQISTGVIYSCANPEGTRSFTVSYSELEEAYDINTLADELASAYENVQVLTINEIPCVSYTISDNDVAGIVTLGASGVGLYQFVFYPASDADYSYLAMQIAASIQSIQ